MTATESLEVLQQQVTALTKTVRRLKRRVRIVEQNAENAGELSLTPEQEAEYERRLQEVEANPGVGIPSEEVFAKIEAKYK